MTQKRLSPEKFIKRAKRRYGDRFLYDKTVYRTKREKVIVTCPTHGDFEVCPQHFLRSTVGCKSCGKQLTPQDFLERSKRLHGERYDYSLVRIVNSTTKVEVICPTHGVFQTVPYLHYTRGTGCPGCYRENDRMGINEFIARSRVVHGAVYDYSKVAYMAGDSAVTIVCPSHGEFQQKPRVHLSGSGCKHCYLVRNRSNKDEFIQQAIKTHGDRYDYSNVVYTTSKEKVEVICFEHGSFWITPNSHTSSGGGCPRCKESKGETRIRVFLERHGINHVQEYKVDPYLYRYDFFLPDYGLLIEYQGQQHFKPVERFGGELYFKQTVESDKVKKVIAEQGGYSLLRLGYWLSKHEGVEIALETVLRATGHTFDESLTITNTWSA